MLASLTPDEDLLCDKACRGERAVLTGKTIRQEVVRGLLSGLTLSQGCSGPKPIGANVLSVEGAVFEDRLDLRDVRCSRGDGLIAVVLEKCTFKNGADLRGVCAARLSLRDCVFEAGKDDLAQLDLRGACIDGDLDLSAIRPGADNGRLWVHAAGLRLQRSLIAKKARLHVSARTGPQEEYRYALDLDGADIGGDIRLGDGFEANGGVKLRNAVISRDVWMDGAELIAGEGSALNGQLLKVGGVFSMGVDGVPGGWVKPTKVKGTVFLLGARIGYLQILGVKIDAPDQWAALDARNIHVAQDFIVGDGDAGETRVEGNVAVTGHVAGNLALTCEIGARGQDARCSLDGVRVDGDLDLSGMRYAAVRSQIFDKAKATDASEKQLGLKDAEIGGALKMWQGEASGYVRERPLICYKGAKLVEVVWAPIANEQLQKLPPERSILAISLEARIKSALVRGTEICELNGTSAVFFDCSERWKLLLKTEEQAREFLELFCAFVWGDEGWFKVLTPGEEWIYSKEDDSGLRTRETYKVPQLVFSKQDGGDGWIIKSVTVAYGGHLFAAELSLAPDGTFQMTDDSPIGMLGEALRVSFDQSRNLRKLRYGAPHLLDPPISGRWRRVDGNHASQMKRKLRIAGLESLWRWWIVDLRGAKCGTLDDADGRLWGKQALMRLERFTYGSSAAPDQSAPLSTERGRAANGKQWWKPGWLRLGPDDAFDAAPRPVWQVRKEWLESQFPTRDPLAIVKHDEDAIYRRDTDFDPQPYAQVSSVLRNSGDAEGARNIDASRLHVEGVIATRQLGWPFSWAMLAIHFLYWLCFRFGLSMSRALVTPAIFFLIGYLGVAEAQRRDMLVVSTTPIAGVALHGEYGAAATPVVTDERQAVAVLTCRNGINAALYAIDLFIPLIDLGEEGKCGVRGEAPEGPSDASFLSSPEFWFWAKSIYAIIGWLVMSLSVLTVSGVIRSRIERSA